MPGLWSVSVPVGAGQLPHILVDVTALPAGVKMEDFKDGVKLSTSYLPANCLAQAPRPGSVPPEVPARSFDGLRQRQQSPVRPLSVRSPPSQAVLAQSPPASSWAATGASPGRQIAMDLAEIGYSQDSILPEFRDGRPLSLMEQELCTGRKTLQDIPTITVVMHGSRWYSVDNRRLYVFKRVFQSGEIPVIVGSRDQRFSNKFTTVNGGRSVRVRAGSGAAYGYGYPF